MKNPNNQHILFLAFVGIFLVSCARKTVDIAPTKLERRKTKDLVDRLDSLSKIQLPFLFTKISTKYEDKNQSLSFKTSLRMVHDSALTATISFASIPIINTLLTKDSLKVVNKRDKCYQEANLSFLKEQFGVDFSFLNVEEMIIGNPLAYDTNQKYFQINENKELRSFYTLSSHRKREIKRTERKDLEDIIIQYFLSPDANELKRMEIESPSDSTQVVIEYQERQWIGKYFLPKEVYIQIFTPRNHLRVNLSYDRIEIEEKPEIFLVIPEGYEVCE